MEGLGRVLNVIPIAAGAGMKVRGASAITFVCTGNDTFTLTVASSFGGSYAAPQTTAIGGGMIHNYYTCTATNGTAAWVKTALANGSYVNAVTIASGTVAFTIFTSQFADPTNYIKCSVGSGGLVTAIHHDLMVQRTPANLEILGA
jgi:hypothetical protein